MTLEEAPEKLYQICVDSDTNSGNGVLVPKNIYFRGENSALYFVETKYYASRWGIQGTVGSSDNVRKVTRESLIPLIYKNINDYEDSNDIRVDRSFVDQEPDYDNMSKEELIRILRHKK